MQASRHPSHSQDNINRQYIDTYMSHDPFYRTFLYISYLDLKAIYGGPATKKILAT